MHAILARPDVDHDVGPMRVAGGRDRRDQAWPNQARVPRAALYLQMADYLPISLRFPACEIRVSSLLRIKIIHQSDEEERGARVQLVQQCQLVRGPHHLAAALGVGGIQYRFPAEAA